MVDTAFLGEMPELSGVLRDWQFAALAYYRVHPARFHVQLCPLLAARQGVPHGSNWPPDGSDGPSDGQDESDEPTGANWDHDETGEGDGDGETVGNSVLMFRFEPGHPVYVPVANDYAYPPMKGKPSQH